MRVLATLLAERRIARLVEQEAIDGAAAYRPSEFFTDLRRAVWQEVDETSVRIDPYRRNLQRALEHQPSLELVPGGALIHRETNRD